MLLLQKNYSTGFIGCGWAWNEPYLSFKAKSEPMVQQRHRQAYAQKTKPFYQLEITLEGPFHKSFCAGVLTPSRLNLTLGMKHYPEKGEINVWFSFIKD